MILYPIVEQMEAAAELKVNGWTIKHDTKPIPDRSFDWDFWHDNHDGDNGLCGNASSITDALEQIADIEADQCEAH